MANDEITTRDLFDKWKDMDDKLEKLNNKIDGVTENGAINTQVTGSNVELSFHENIVVGAGSSYEILANDERKDFTKLIIKGRWRESTNSYARVWFRSPQIGWESTNTDSHTYFTLVVNNLSTRYDARLYNADTNDSELVALAVLGVR